MVGLVKTNQRKVSDLDKDELVTFLKEEHRRIEDVLYSLGEITEVVQDRETLNRYIQDQFRDAQMYLKNGRLDQLENFLNEKSTEKWIYSKGF